MTRMQIEDCKDPKVIKEIALEQHSALFKISEALVDNSKSHLTDEQTLESIRHYLVENTRELDDIIRGK